MDNVRFKYPRSTYSSKLKNPLWQKKRLEVLQRDNWKCTYCKAVDKELQVHHLDYIKGIEPWDYPLDMFTTLCDDCHSKEALRPKHERYLLQSLKMKGFLACDIVCLSTMIDKDTVYVKSLRALIRRNY